MPLPIKFTKFQGFGNDYIIFENWRLGEIGSFSDFARAVCNRHYGAGADGIVIVEADEGGEADFRLRIFNADGSEAGLSGNGTRCAAAYLHFKELWYVDELRLSTKSGVKLYRLVQAIAPGHYWFESELGEPRFDPPSIPFLVGESLEKVIDYPVKVNGLTLNITALQMGNPNCAVFVDDFAALDWRVVGKHLENHERFPDRTNVEFVKVIDPRTIELRLWERGVGETLSSGTCACAAVIASALKGLTDRRVKVIMEGGETEIEWRQDNEVVLTGRADVVYDGEWLGLSER